MKITHDQIKSAYDTAKKRGKITDTTTVAEQVLDVVGECVEFVDAWRNHQLMDDSYRDGKDIFIREIAYNVTAYRNFDYYEWEVSGTIQDEIADIWISLLTLAGVMGYQPESSDSCCYDTPVEYYMTLIINMITAQPEDDIMLDDIFALVADLAKHLNIDLKLHVRAKMAYNAVRED